MAIFKDREEGIFVAGLIIGFVIGIFSGLVIGAIFI